MKNVALHNLGCKVNSYEMEVMQQKLEEKGYNIVAFDEIADIYIVNTCTVTNIADRKSRQMLHRARQLNPEAVVVAAGCYVQTGAESIEKDDSVDLCIGNNRKAEIVDIIEKYLESRDSNKTLDNSTVIDINHTSEYEDMTLKHTAGHTRACIKIQDGCNQFCSYCVIPFARGRVRSRGESDILEEIRGLVQEGCKEVVLTGIHISSYGLDFDSEGAVYDGHSSLIDLVEKVNEIKGLKRIRLGSLEPRIITEDTAVRLGRLEKLCPHFHLSLQSGCNETLKRMNRHYTSGEYFQSVELIRKYFEHPAVTTDIIVGFPGETEDEYSESREFIEKVRFYETHVFKYSMRSGTRAALMPNQLPDEIKTLRSNELIRMGRIHSEEFRRYYIGKTAEVLFEEEKEIKTAEGSQIYHIGHTRDYVKVAVPADDVRSMSNAMAQVKVSGFIDGEILAGEMLEFYI
ncbi:MAG: tRNA (N(6)-L-threonylcarbamoyladenosine(37)-C(2))-methylthiotransferase MtaB [Lachnospiraceae bacterium]|nr:tRNA (N(6)-L-threonylcarbamoyladenosine(37)-C(2))-methylthiotransferase MtaB [Lachnospiraceae bacterium]